MNVPLLDEAAASIRATGQYRADLTADDARDLALTVVGDVLAEQSHVRAHIVDAAVQIAREEGSVSGSVRISSPVSVTLHPRVVLGNDQDPSRIRLILLTLESEANFVARGMLRALNIEGRARSLLADPNRALAGVLEPELRARGAVLRDLQLHFADSVLTAHLHGGTL